MNTKTPKAIKGYWSNGRFVKPEEIALEEVGPPSKTQLKAEADEKQALGEALLTLRADLMAKLDLPETGSPSMATRAGVFSAATCATAWSKSIIANANLRLSASSM